MDTRFLAMESIMEQIRTRLQGGESPQELIKNGFKRTTVYSIAKKVKSQVRKDSGDQSLDRDIYLLRIIESAFMSLIDVDAPNCDPAKEWDSCVKMAAEWFEEDTGRKPPKDFLTE